MEGNWIRGAFSTHEKLLTTFMMGKSVEIILLEDVHLDGSILKWRVKKEGERVGLGSSGSGLGPVTGCR
jgi:hypothetical protein